MGRSGILLVLNYSCLVKVLSELRFGESEGLPSPGVKICFCVGRPCFLHLLVVSGLALVFAKTFSIDNVTS